VSSRQLVLHIVCITSVRHITINSFQMEGSTSISLIEQGESTIDGHQNPHSIFNVTMHFNLLALPSSFTTKNYSKQDQWAHYFELRTTSGYADNNWVWSIWCDCCERHEKIAVKANENLDPLEICTQKKLNKRLSQGQVLERRWGNRSIANGL